MFRRIIFRILPLVLLSLGTSVPAQAQSFVLRTSVFSAGAQRSAAGNLVLQGTLGQPGIDRATVGNLVMQGGFWPQVTGAAGPLAVPTATADAATTDEDTAVVIDVLANDTNPAGGVVTIVNAGSPAHGQVVQSGDATFTYTPEANFFGEDGFVYTIQNEDGGRAQATVTITVNPVNDAPVFTSTPVAAAVVGAEYRYRAIAADVDGQALTFTATGLPAWLALVEQTDSTATLAGTPTAADAGEHAVTLAVSDGQASAEQPFRITVAMNVATEDAAGVPTAFALHPNYPNPFNPTTTLAYDLPEAGPVRLAVYDLFGREVARLVDAVQPAGRYAVAFEAEGLASGTYFYRLEAGRWRRTRSFVLLQ